ncbi:MAG TPA: flagellin [bacterium]|jgi:flagellin|nr:flagellin [bacterium]
MTTINTNTASLNAQRNLSTTATSLSTAMQRLSSGLRVNSAKDDAAGLAIAERMNTQTRGMNVAIRNANDAISLAQTAEGALGAITNNLQRMRELAVQAANGTNGATDIAALDAEYQLLAAENTRVIGATKFNSQALLSAATPFQFQVGANSGESITITSVIAVQTATTLGATNASASAQLAVVDTDLNLMNSIRATWGASQNRFEGVISNLRVAAENSAAARGRIMDADYAMETANLSRAQVLQQAGTAMVAQANQLPQSVLSLLRQ